MTEKDEKRFGSNNICRFCEKEIKSDKGTDHCHLTGKNRGAAHNQGNIKITQKQCIFIPFVILNLANYDCHLLFEKLVD